MAEFENERLGARLARAREFRALKQKELAELISRQVGYPIPAQTIQITESRNSKTSEYAVQIARALQVNLAWLLDGEGEMTSPCWCSGVMPGKQAVVMRDPLDASNEAEFSPMPLTGSFALHGIEPWDETTPLGPDEIEVPFYKEVEFAAGSGRTPGLEITDRKIRFGTRSLEAAGADPDAVLCALNKGKSMEDLIQDRAMIAIDTSKKKVSNGFIYAFNQNGQDGQDGELRVKYLYNLKGGGLRIVSHNADKDEFPDEELGADWKRRISIIGWVWTWSPPIKRWKEK
jgi:phage repressor protein C with HTH and peptisase S24 domain